MMNPEDPIQSLEAHYRALQGLPVPALSVRKPMRWYEAVGGIAAGIAAVFIAVSTCLAGSSPAKSSGGALLQSQMRSAGLVQDEPQTVKHAQAEGPWHI
jgi:hypothetical protein